MVVEGVRVLELARYQAGSGGGCSFDLGAEAIKIEKWAARRGGRVGRAVVRGQSVYFRLQSRQEELCLDLRAPGEAKGGFRSMVSSWTSCSKLSYPRNDWRRWVE